jgi:DNA processing protein
VSSGYVRVEWGAVARVVCEDSRPMTSRIPERERWIAWAMRSEILPSLLARIVRAGGGDPPLLPLRVQDIPDGVELRPGDVRSLCEPRPDLETPGAMLARGSAGSFRVITPAEDAWLAKFWAEMEDPPAALFVRGALHDVDRAAVAIVGTRHPSANGLDLAYGIARDLAAQGISVISGMALGIDGAAHRGALDAAGHTVAVLGSGVDNPTPTSHAGLAARIVSSGGALVSEFPFGTVPRPLHFPRRNRIIAAFAHIVVIVEGSERSGARSTADHALAIGREVVAVPRDPIHEGSALPNLLLKTGATPVRSAIDVIEILEGCGGKMVTCMEDEERQTLSVLVAGRRQTIQSIACVTGLPAERVMLALGRLEIAGRVRRLPGPRFARVEAPATLGI